MVVQGIQRRFLHNLWAMCKALYMSELPAEREVPRWDTADRMRKALREADIGVQERVHECLDSHLWDHTARRPARRPGSGQKHAPAPRRSATSSTTGTGRTPAPSTRPASSPPSTPRTGRWSPAGTSRTYGTRPGTTTPTCTPTAAPPRPQRATAAIDVATMALDRPQLYLEEAQMKRKGDDS